MKSGEYLEFLNNQLTGAERLLRSVRSQLERQLIESESYLVEMATPHLVADPLFIGMGQAGLSAKGAIGPNTELYPGVFCSYNRAEAGNSVRLHAVQVKDPSNDGTRLLSSVLVLHALINELLPTQWLSFEIALDPAVLQQSRRLDVQFMLGLRGVPRPETCHVDIMLRGFPDEGPHTDHYQRTFPLFGPPLEFTYSVSQEEISAIAVAGLRKWQILLLFPVVPGHEYALDLHHWYMLTRR